MYVGEQGGEWGKQVGSLNEESQVSRCYNITFIYTNQETVYTLHWNSCIGAQVMRALKGDQLLQGHWGKEDTAGPAWKFLHFR